VLELKEKIDSFHIESDVPKAEIEAVEALEALGYPPKDTRAIVRLLAKENATPQLIIRKALQTLGGQ
jgi:Holliday junction resolvasome RuvABC DNA-binding subunit